MSYVTLASLPSFNKCIISFWFKMSSAAMNSGSGSSTLGQENIVPLVVMGKEGTGSIPYDRTSSRMPAYHSSGCTTFYSPNAIFDHTECTNLVNVWASIGQELWCCFTMDFYARVPDPVVSCGESTSYAFVYNTTPTDPAPPTPPTCIGVSNNCLYVNFETAKKPSVSSYSYDLSSVNTVSYSADSTRGGLLPGTYKYGTCDRSSIPCFLLDIECFSSDWQPVADPYPSVPSSPPIKVPCATNNWTDTTDITMTATGALTNHNNTNISPDKWHHVLVSVDMSKGVSTFGAPSDESWDGTVSSYVSSAAKLYTAIDDVNQTEFDVCDDWPSPNGGPNDALTSDAYKLAGTTPQYDYGCPDDSGHTPRVQVGGIAKYTLNNMSVPAGPLGIPATAAYKSDVHHCEMAEFQMWVGQSIDPASQSNRRLFIDSKGKPVDPKVAAQQLGKPTVLFHGSGNWIKAHNTGTGADGTPTGKIKRYKPDPQLGR